VLVGAAAYCGAAWFTSRSTAADLAQLLRAAFLRASPALVEAPRDLGGGARP